MNIFQLYSKIPFHFLLISDCLILIEDFTLKTPKYTVRTKRKSIESPKKDNIEKIALVIISINTSYAIYYIHVQIRSNHKPAGKYTKCHFVTGSKNGIEGLKI